MPAHSITRREAVAVLAGAVWAVACRSGTAPVTPAPVVFGRDECSYCRMIIDRDGLTAELVRGDGTAELFGEPGCLLAWLSEHPGERGTPFVTDERSGEWIGASEARYTRGVRRTPMRFDVVAHAAPDAGAGSLTWDALRAEGKPNARSS